MSAIRFNPCEGDGLSSRAPESLRKRTARVRLHLPGTLRLPCDVEPTQPDDSPWRFFIEGLVSGANKELSATENNEVRYLIDAPVYFADLAREISQAGDPATRWTSASDFVYIIGWYLGIDFPMVYDPNDPCGTGFEANSNGLGWKAPGTLGQLLYMAAGKGAEIRVLMFTLPTSAVNATAANVINDMFNDAGARLNTFAICDGRLLLAGAHHQKLVVIRRGGILTGYCGGIDLNPDRLFPQDTEARQTINKSADRGDPYHDVQCRIRGPAAGYLLRTFAERWNDHRTHQVDVEGELTRHSLEYAEAELQLTRTRQFYEQNLKSLDDLEAAQQAFERVKNDIEILKAKMTIFPLCVDQNAPTPLSNLPGMDAFANRQIVQIGRTFGDPLHHKFWSPFKNKRKIDADLTLQALPWTTSEVEKGPMQAYNTYDFAPHGEQTIKQLLLRAIARARRFIYVEDQYLMDQDIARAVAAVLPRLAHFTALVPSDEDLETSFRVNVASGHLTSAGHFFRNHAVPLRKMFLDIVKAAGGARARIFVHKDQGQPHTYVHSKMWIIDDEFVLIGSANCNQRSLTHDGEICAAIADQVRAQSCGLNLAHRLRIALWAEHLGMDTLDGQAELVDGIASADHWLEGKRPASARIMNHVPGPNEGDVVLNAVAQASNLLPGFLYTVGVVIRRGIFVKQYVLEPALIPFLFEPLGACPHRRILPDGTSTIANPITND